MPRQIWNYYKELARRIGTDSEGKQQGFSVSWFYTEIREDPVTGEDIEVDTFDRQNSLSLAFLGDADARNNVHLAGETEISDMCRTVRSICGQAPNPSQIEAISNALLNDLTIIQGPPGTGKTDTIKNILLCIRSLYPDAKVAVISANREAIANAEDAVKEEPSLATSYARLGAKSVRKEFKEALFTSDRDLYNRLGECNKENGWFYPEWFLDEYPIIFSTIHSLRKCVDIPEYDYVLVDECSQVQSVIGMLAINTAKHLVLLGDDEQLPPIHKEEENEEIAEVLEIRQRAPFYLDEGDNSFMKACKASFGDKCRSILLNEHYRCHPAIIKFCNRFIYDNQLITRTADDGKLPIRIRWYEGDYWEKIPDEKTRNRNNEEQDNPDKLQNVNKKQIEIFIREEYPEILEMLRANHNYGICVLSPYRYQLELLQARLSELIEENDEVENTIVEHDPGVNDIAQLTIHKAQGRGFDRVYIMPVEDTGKNPWSQKKELINVAVSRAKKELCVITSSAWMSDGLQKELLGYRVNYAPENAEQYIRSLLQYVEEEQKSRDCGEDYGFVKADASSVFDKVPYYRRKLSYSDEKRKPDGNMPSAPEKCLYEALKACEEFRNGGYEIYREVPLSSFTQITTYNNELRTYMENGARFDFVIGKEKKLYAIIEVDGAYHRSDPETMHNDELKDRAARSFGNDFYENRFLRLPTDGTTADEIRQIMEILESAPEREIIIHAEEVEENCMIDYFDQKMRECANLIGSHIRNGEPDEELGRVLGLRGYIDPQDTDYHYDDPLYNAVYFMRYGYAYAYEYSVIYQIILEDYVSAENIFGVTTFGCGSCIDAWALAYAKKKLGSELTLRYAGTDRDIWGIRFKPEPGNAMEEAYRFDGDTIRYRYPGMNDMQADILDFFREESWQYLYNTVFFSKILNELPDDYLNSLLECIRENADEFKADRTHYICISHSDSDYRNKDSMKNVAKEIADRINYDNRFTVDYSLPVRPGGLGESLGLRDISPEGFVSCYKFPRQGDFFPRVATLNPDFEFTEEVEEIRNILERFLDRKCVSTTSTSIFQIIKLIPN